MKIFIWTFLILLISISTLTACGSSSLDPDTFSVEISVQDNSNWWSGAQTVSVLMIRSNVAEQIEVTNVTVNNGQCGYQNINFPRYFQMGQILKLQLKCHVNNVVQVDVETTQGQLSYQFN
ncbi:hypothetical protein B9T31_05005 [Acinetobacter sp. ANC 4558]|uniref:hypothetical protein n=1 Tax=Acinetobacter sp. ANC 4558 TaxID=1977876 RepID=UPI000A351708|nr:hypothetical protein [Acinetobacter sp. ANC 4558]OTG86977.1 hypothetical protein B9T31_05005 [Acinetobacter sp. ANC 4558]